MRESLLRSDPEIESVTMDALVSIADRVERESVQRYAALEDLMARRGEVATAAAFRFLLNEELAHVEAVRHWADRLGQPVSESATFKWRLPADLASSWDEIAGSARLTPYRAFAIAVDNEQRAYQMYSHLCAHAADARIAGEAEKLGLEELRHAALMRHWRRQAWHRERRSSATTPPDATALEPLHDMLARHEARVATRLRSVVERLRAIGDEESAALLEQLREDAWLPAVESDGSVDTMELDPHAQSVHLLVAAREPLEAFAEALETAMQSMEGDRFADAAPALGSVIRRLGRVALRIAALLQRR